MTDNEIIKALEICADYENCVSRDSVLTYRGIPLCYLFKETIDLINRQRAEIERYKGVIKILEKDVDAAKCEAIKEFAERFEYFVLHEDIEVVDCKCTDYKNYVNGANQFRHQVKNGIYTLAKKLTEHKQTVSMIDGHIEE